MRLIDANNLQFNGRNYNKSQMKAILDFIDAQPTAYDPDKVVEQFGCGGMLTDIIDVVKAGGADAEH